MSHALDDALDRLAQACADFSAEMREAAPRRTPKTDFIAPPRAAGSLDFTVEKRVLSPVTLTDPVSHSDATTKPGEITESVVELEIIRPDPPTRDTELPDHEGLARRIAGLAGRLIHRFTPW